MDGPTYGLTSINTITENMLRSLYLYYNYVKMFTSCREKWRVYKVFHL